MDMENYKLIKVKNLKEIFKIQKYKVLVNLIVKHIFIQVNGKIIYLKVMVE